MKKLVFSMLGLFLLGQQVNAWQEPAESASTKPDTNVNLTVNLQDQADDPTKARTFNKTFAIDKNDKVDLVNQFGSITIKTWAKNEIKVDADIKAYANTEAEAQKLLDGVSINATKTGDLVAFKTNINSNFSSWGRGSRNGKKWRREVKIHLIVYMPSTNALSASQSYGNVVMEDFVGPTAIKVQYGNFTGGNLSNENNVISIQYGKGNIEALNQARIKHQYGSGLTIGTVNAIDLDAQYTAVTINTIKNTGSLKHQYGSGINIGNAGALTVNAQYTSLKINKLQGNMTSKIQYGKLSVSDVQAGKNVEVNAAYTSVNLNFAANYNGNFNVNTNYGGFKYGNNINAKKEGDERNYSSSKKYTGQIGKGGEAKVVVNSQYNSVTFN